MVRCEQEISMSELTSMQAEVGMWHREKFGICDTPESHAHITDAILAKILEETQELWDASRTDGASIPSERAVKLWSNEGDTVFSPFAGIGSEGYQSVKMGRKFVGIELKEAYFAQAVKNICKAESEVAEKGLFA